MTNSINLLHLKFFCDSAIHGSVSEAAKMNFVTQSAVSQGISKLEKVLGAQLVIHSKQKFKITEEGQVVFEQARHVFKSIRNIHEGLSNQNKNAIGGAVQFATTKSLGVAVIPSGYKQAKAQFPQIDLRMHLGGLTFIRNMLKQKQVEFAIVVYDQNFEQFEKVPIRKGRFNLYQGADNLENAVLVNYFKGTYVQELSQYLEQHSSLRVQMELSGWEVLARFAEMNMGIGFFPDYILADNRYSTLKPYPLSLPNYEYEICAIFNKGDKLSRAAELLINQFTVDS
jgi:DNA-binding transcriptional LysR family regulator